MEELLFKLAQTEYWQLQYYYFKEGSNIILFDNKKDLTCLQIRFLEWLRIIDKIKTDIAMEEKYANKDILKEYIYTLAYLYYINNRPKEDKKENKSNNKKSLDSIRYRS